MQFARKFADADEMLEHLIEEQAAPKSLVVVSGDHRVQRAARRRGAEYVDSDRWFADLRAQQKAAPGAETPARPEGKLPPDQVDYWLEQFSRPRPGNP